MGPNLLVVLLGDTFGELGFLAQALALLLGGDIGLTLDVALLLLLGDRDIDQWLVFGFRIVC